MPAFKRLLFAQVGLALASLLRAAPADEVQADLLAGRYPAALQRAEEALRVKPQDEDVQVLLVRALLTVGRYPDASAAAARGLAHLPAGIRLRWIGREAALANGQSITAAQMTAEIRQFVASQPYAYRDAPDLVVFAREALLLGADPKDVIDKVLATAQQIDPGLRDITLAKGELALDKHDFDLAAKTYQEGLKRAPDDPDFHYGLARAFADGDRASMLAELDAALKANPRHVPSLLLLADHRIDSEDYAGAAELLDEIIAVNPWQPEAWAYRAVLAHLRNALATEKVLRQNALHFWPDNPAVDWLIGKKLAEKYRFAEAAPHERQALQFDPECLPAKEELANDLLRLGQEEEGWRLAKEVQARDAYDVEAYNLATLHDTMAKYATLTNGDFVVRMPAAEAQVYGPRVLDLLGRARAKLTAKYGVELVRPTYVEIFGDQKDFAVRTFGVPDIGGFLGVCFGRVVTANSPASNSAQPSNWETVLWHEFCHVVTLQLTQNKMPRWLSEGISVYEEGQADPSWGMHMDPRYREMILQGALTPVGSLSAAFLAPPSPQQLQFAYFESSLVVDFIISHYGLEQLKGILRDLGAGREINEAIAAHTAPLADFERDFTTEARAKAQALAPGLAWDRPEAALLVPGAEQPLADWARAHPDNYYALQLHARGLLDARQWGEAQAVLTHFLALDPAQIGPDSAWRQLAAVDRTLGERAARRGETAGPDAAPEAERAALTRLAEIDDNAADACLRLTELAAAAKDWPAVQRYAGRFIAVNPLVATPYRYLARAAEERGDLPEAIAADRTVLLLAPPNPSEVHFQLARLLRQARDPAARRQVLEALEDAPRYRDALALLLDLDRDSAAPSDPRPPARLAPSATFP
jgi:predicted Zn-dependent protease